MKNAGFIVKAAVDFDPKACETYRLNHPEVNLVESDIRDVHLSTFDDLKKNLDLLAVCAPCQPFSSRNRNKMSSDDRVALVLEACRFIEYLQPKFIVFENVPGLERNQVFAELEKFLIGQEYHVSRPEKLDAAELGVPQRRVRMILFAAKSAKLLESAANIQPQARKSVRDAIGDLPSAVERSNSLVDQMHFRRAHSALNLERLRHIPKNGGSRHSLPHHLVLDCHRGIPDHHYPDCYGRMHWEQPAPTLTTGCTDFTKGRYVHPEDDRAITLREAARLQTFPDEYQFAGNSGQIATQIGNAVPPTMMSVIAASIRSALTKGI